jgi:hypothetical protein
MPVRTLDASAYTELRKILTASQVSISLNPLKFRAPFVYNGFYRPGYSVNITQPGIPPVISPSFNPVVATLDFTTTLNGSCSGSKYVIYDLPNATRSVTFTYTNVGSINGNAYPEINSDSFNFQSDGSQLVLAGSPTNEIYTTSCFSTYSVSEDDVSLKNNDVLILTTTNPISGRLYVGFNVTT